MGALLFVFCSRPDSQDVSLVIRSCAGDRESKRLVFYRRWPASTVLHRDEHAAEAWEGKLTFSEQSIVDRRSSADKRRIWKKGGGLASLVLIDQGR